MSNQNRIAVFLLSLTFLFSTTVYAKDHERNSNSSRHQSYVKNTYKKVVNKYRNEHKKKHDRGRPFAALIAMIEENKSVISSNHKENINQDQALLEMIESNKSLIDHNQEFNETQNKSIMDLVSSFMDKITANKNQIDSNHQQNLSQEQLLLNMIEESQAYNAAQNQSLLSMIESNQVLIDTNQNQNVSQDQMLLNMIEESRALISANSADIASLALTTNDLKLKVTSIDNEIIAIQDRVTINENELRGVMTQLEQSSHQISMITQDLVTLSTTHANDLAAINTEISWLKAQVSGLDQELKALAEDLSLKLVDINTAISENSIALDGLMNEVLLLTAETTQITALISSLNTSIADLEQRSAQHQDQLDILAQQFTALSAQVTEITTPAIVDVDLTGVHAEYEFDGRKVYFWKTPPCADLNQFQNFCQNRGLSWWRAKSQADAQKLLDFGYNLDSYHTWIQIHGVTSQPGSTGLLDGFDVNVNGPSCIAGSSDGFTGIRKWGCSMCNPEDNGNKSCCWDIGHQYDWFVCEQPATP